MNPKVPTNLRLLRGNPGKRPINKHEPQPARPAQCPAPPAFLSAYAKEEWERTSVEAYSLGLLTNLDTACFAVYCESYSRWKSAVLAMKEAAAADPEYHGLLVRNDEGGLRMNPLCRIVSTAAGDLLRMAAEFGFTPVARSRIGEFKPPRPPSKFAGLLADFSNQDRDRDWPA